MDNEVVHPLETADEIAESEKVSLFISENKSRRKEVAVVNGKREDAERCIKILFTKFSLQKLDIPIWKASVVCN